MIAQHLQQADVVLLLYDVQAQASFEEAKALLKDQESYFSKMILVANKSGEEKHNQATFARLKEQLCSVQNVIEELSNQIETHQRMPGKSGVGQQGYKVGFSSKARLFKYHLKKRFAPFERCAVALDDKPSLLIIRKKVMSSNRKYKSSKSRLA